MATGVNLGKMGSFELNPRGNIWFKDDTTLGHKLLSKMGWSKGKGLGKNEDGITENIKMFKKDNMTGVGYKNDMYISVGCIEYENILKKLQHHFKTKDSCNTVNMESLEQRSRNSKSRLHYQKFIKGKDLFKCSEKDMKCIFLENPQDLCESYSKNSTDEEITTVTSELSVSDYFAQKMQQKLGFFSKGDDVPENVTFEKSHPTLSKKRKIDEGSEIQKKIKLECDEYLNETSPPSKRKIQDSSNLEVMTSYNSKIEKSVLKKKKIPKIKNLKSCIKYNSTCNLNKNRKVCFNECVSYRILDDSIENITENSPLNDCNKEFDTVNCLQVDINRNNNKEKENEMLLESNQLISKQCNEETSHLIDDNNKIEKVIEKDEENQDQDRTSASVEDSDSYPQCLDLPVCSVSSYNCWLESQRTALKMKLYKNMIKKFKKHNVLSTTNLLDIKGYGNWGFKM